MTKKDTSQIQKAYESIGLGDFYRYAKSPWRIMWSNFLAGLFRGIGLIVAWTLLLTIAVWVASKFVDFPVIGESFEDIKRQLEQISSGLPR